MLVLSSGSLRTVDLCVTLSSFAVITTLPVAEWNTFTYFDNGSRDVWVSQLADEVCGAVEVIQFQSTSLKLIMTQASVRPPQDES